MRVQLVELPVKGAHPEARMPLKSSQVQSLVGIDEEMGHEPRQGLRAEDPEATTLVLVHRPIMRRCQVMGKECILCERHCLTLTVR